MTAEEPVFSIPTCRLRDVGAALEAYDRHFTEYEQPAEMIVFDDSDPALQQQYFDRLNRVATKNPLWYVGYQQKTALKALVCERLRDRRLAPLVHQLFRPSYGGNRNFTLAYSLGRLLVSADDDMRPFALIEEDASALAPNEICRGKVVAADSAPQQREATDILGAFHEVLGKKVGDAPDAYARGELLVDTAMDLETNASRGFVHSNSLLLKDGEIAADATIKMAQTFRSGTNDIDALDFVDMFLANSEQTSMDALSDVYVLNRFRPAITNKNWRMDCGVAGYDNRAGLPPFFPTRLRFEDYIYRLWIQQPGLAAAHVAAAQNHSKSPYMRNPPASEVLNEEAANLLKRKIHTSISGLHPLGVTFDYEGELEAEDAEMILDKMASLKDRVVQASEQCRNVQRTLELVRFAVTLDATFHGFERDLFHYSLRRTLKDTVSAIKSSLELWPSILEICSEAATKNQLPRLRLDTH